MNFQPTLPYKTEQLEMTKVVFESMVNNLGDRIRRMNFELHFKTSSEKAAFLTAMQREKEREENEVQIDSDEQKNAENQQQKDITCVFSRQVNGLDTIVIEETFEKSILLREKFMDKLKNIGERLKVSFMVVPNKVKISGIIRDRVDQAQQEYRQIQENICFEPIDKYGKEVYQSKFFKDYLKEKKVEVIQILRKYYFWFLKSEVNDPIDVINEVFQQTKHASYPLHMVKMNDREAIVSGKGGVALGEIQFIRNEEKITDRLFVCVRSRIFEKHILKKFNQMEDRKKRQVQLSEDRKALILHMDAQEQLVIQRESLDEEYKGYDYLFFIFNEKEVDMNKLSQFLENMNISDIILEKENNYVCLSYAKEGQPLSQEKIANHPLLKMVNELPLELLKFKLGIFQSVVFPEQPEWAFMIAERNHSEKITVVGVKSGLRKSYERMIRLYVEKKISLAYLMKAREEKLNASVSNATEISIDMSRPINESTQFMENHFDHTVVLKKEKENVEEVNSILNGDTILKINFRFENYDILLRETEQEREKKFVEKEGKIESGKIPVKNEVWDQQLFAVTSFKFKYYRIKISQAFRKDMQQEVNHILAEKPQLSHLNRWITVFVGAKDNEQFNSLYNSQARVKITKLEKNYKIKEGYMVTTNSLFIFLSENEQLPLGTYQATCWVRRIE